MKLRNYARIASLALVAACVSAALFAQEGPGGRRLRPTAGAAAPDVFGPGTAYHWIPAAAFSAERSDTGYAMDPWTEYLYRTGGGDSWFAAPLGLDDGSFLQGIRLFYYDDSDANIEFFVCKYYSHADGTNPGGTCSDAQTSAGTPGYGSLLLSLNETVRLYDDVDGDGTDDDVRWIVLVSLPSAIGDLHFAGVRALWRRQVSPAPLAATFNDVPTSDPAFQFIEALAASGITAGCSLIPALYCPDATLTRRQMAVFLAKALGLHWSPSYP